MMDKLLKHSDVEATNNILVEKEKDTLQNITNGLPKTTNRVIIFLFLGLLLLPLQNFSQNPVQFNQTFWQHDTLLKWFSEFRHSVLKDSYFDQVIVGKNNWLLYIDKDSVQDIQYTNQFSQDNLVKIQSKLDRANAYFEKQNITFVVVITPDKNSIYPEYIPEQIPVLGKQSRLDQLVNYENEQGGFRVIDLRSSLILAREKTEVYYPDDTHWNPIGAQIAYVKIMSELQKRNPQLRAHSLDEYQLVPTGISNGDLANLAGINTPNQKFTLEPKFGKTYTQQYFKTDQITKITLTGNSNPAAPIAVIFQDSFFEELIPFFSDHFSKGIYIMSQSLDKTLIARERPNIIIMEYTERYMQRLLDIPDL